MFNSRARYLKNIYNLVSKISWLILSIVSSVLFILNALNIINIIPDFLYIDKNNNWIVLLTNTLFFGLIFGVIGFVFLIYGLFLKKYCIKIYSEECMEIINSTQLPKKLPKVLYIYTCHNDLINSRVLQNKNQTYKNFELWVSDGSSSKEWRNKIKNFCKENNINLFQLERPSVNKADNLNQFLNFYKGEYDYILIGDADEVFHESFVEYAVKMFISNRIKNLAYITPLNINYRSKGIYSNTTRIIETTAFYWTLFSKNFNLFNIAPLCGQSCIVSKKAFKECYENMNFDSGNLEDWYLESRMVETNNFGIMLLDSPCYYEPDVNVQVHLNRMSRVIDWIIRWWKLKNVNVVKEFNERYIDWYKNYITILFLPLIVFMSIGLIGVFLWIVWNYYNYAFVNNTLFWVTLGTILGLFIFSLVLNTLLIGNISYNTLDYFLFPIIFICWIFATNVKITIHWFKSLFLSKYSQFGGSGNSRFFKTKSKTIKWWFSFFILGIILAVFNSLIFTLTSWNNIKWLIIFFDLYFGTFWMGTLSYLILWYINFIPYNSKFQRDSFIECKKIK